MQFSPKIFGPNVGMIETVFEQFGIEFLTVIELCVLFLCVIAGKIAGCVKKLMLIYAYMMY